MVRTMDPSHLRSHRGSKRGSLDLSPYKRPFRSRRLRRSFPLSPVGLRQSCEVNLTSSTEQIADIIPTPDLGAGPSSSNLADLVPVHDFENLNKEAGSPSSTSRRLEQTLEHVQNLLNPARLTKM